MKARCKIRPLALVVTVLWLAHAGAASAADVTQVPGTTANAKRLVEGTRLSQWLLDHPVADDRFLDGLSWQVDAQKKVQEAERSALLLYMVNAPIAGRGRVPASDRLMQWLKALPITGRVSVPATDARWLQIHPESDPVLDPLDQVVVPKRPTHVVVFTPSGDRCVLPHLPGFTAADYLAACPASAVLPVDWAYVAQPDGHVKRVPTSLYNRDQQSEPGPGAWIFAPGSNGPWSAGLATRLTAFIATQGPAGDDVLPTEDQVNVTSLNPVPLSVRPNPVSSSDWGVTGLLQTPTARMRETGSLSATFSRVAPYSRASFIFQPIDWLEAGFRYSILSNQRYGVVAGSDQAYADKSVDVKVRLFEETRHLPAVAVGLRDIGGTGLFSGEYLVANKRFGDFDASLGLGWGNVGARGDLPNPFGLSDRAMNPTSGQFSFDTYFHGRTAPFGGVTWQTPYQPLQVKVEYDGNNYRHEPFNTVLPVNSSINLGVLYRATPTIDVTVGLERGNTGMFSISFHDRLSTLSTPKFADPAPIPVAPTRPFYVDPLILPTPTPTPGPTPGAQESMPISATSGSAPISGSALDQLVPVPVVAQTIRPAGDAAPAPLAVRASDPPGRAVELATSPVDWARTARDIQTQTGWRTADIRPDGRDLRITFANPDSVYWRGLLNRAIAVLHRDAPAQFDRFRIVLTVRGVAMTEYLVFRDYWVEEQDSYQAPQDKRHSVVTMPAHDDPLERSLYASREALVTGGLGLSYAQSVGGPDNLLLWQIGIEASGEIHITPHIWAFGAVNYRVLDNYSNFTYDAPSELPRVRTDIREYLESSRLTMPNLQLTTLNQFGPDQFFTMYGGYLEPMFAGVGAEYLYRPLGSPFALGFDANEVKQRGFKQDFALMQYHTFTGFATLYWQTGWHQITASLAVGEYLAKDKGATLSLSRVFNNGTVVGAYATKTNISAATFGEGSFDKGIFLSVPFDAILGRSSGYSAPIRYVPVLRDGGQQLSRAYPLYNLTELRDSRTLDFGPPPADGSDTDGP